MSTAERIRRLLKAGQTTEQIVVELGVTRQRVHVVRWKLNNPEKRAASARAYWQRNRKVLIKKDRERRRQHKEQEAARKKEMLGRIKNLERQLAAARKLPKRAPANWYGGWM